MSELSITSKTRPSRLFYDEKKKEFYVVENGIRKIVRVPPKLKKNKKAAQSYILDKIVGKMNLKPNKIKNSERVYYKFPSDRVQKKRSKEMENKNVKTREDKIKENIDRNKYESQLADIEEKLADLLANGDPNNEIDSLRAKKNEIQAILGGLYQGPTNFTQQEIDEFKKKESQTQIDLLTAQLNAIRGIKMPEPGLPVPQYPQLMQPDGYVQNPMDAKVSEPKKRKVNKDNEDDVKVLQSIVQPKETEPLKVEEVEEIEIKAPNPPKNNPPIVPGFNPRVLIEEKKEVDKPKLSADQLEKKYSTTPISSGTVNFVNIGKDDVSKQMLKLWEDNNATDVFQSMMDYFLDDANSKKLRKVATQYYAPYERKSKENDLNKIIANIGPGNINRNIDHYKLPIKKVQKGKGSTEISDGDGRNPSNPRPELFDDEIADYFSNSPHFAGVIACDQIPDLPNKIPMGFVMNTDPSHMPGQHWVACYINGDSVEYFDPLADPPTEETVVEIKKKLDQMRIPILMKFKVNKIVQQHGNSAHCGYHCIRFLDDRFNGIPFPLSTRYGGKTNNSKEGEKIIKDEFKLI
jgi:hypothetical protein